MTASTKEIVAAAAELAKAAQKKERKKKRQVSISPSVQQLFDRSYRSGADPSIFDLIHLANVNQPGR